LKLLEALAKFCAILAGALMTLITVLTCVSIIGRELMSKTVPGDFELVGLATGAAIGLFMPLCQIQRGNIIVDFFTSKMPKKVNAGLDRLAAMTLGLCTHSGTMLLGVPEWIAYATMVPAFGLTAVIALYQFVFGFGQYANHGHAEIAEVTA
jgi:TRAP-type C4-dicarboxylate transport system permease small subunit